MDVRDVVARVLIYMIGYPVFELIHAWEMYEDVCFSLSRFIGWSLIVAVLIVGEFLYDSWEEKTLWKKYKSKQDKNGSQRTKQNTEHQKQIEYARAAQGEIDRRQQAALQEAFMREQENAAASDCVVLPENGTDEEENTDAP